MSLVIKNTKDLLGNNLKFKCLIYGASGVGKSLFASTCPNPIIAACETGVGGGLLTAADTGLPYVTPSSYSEIEQFCSGVGLEKYDTVVLDGFSYLTDTIVRDEALTIPRKGMESLARQKGILELSDFGVLAELERRLLARLLQLDKNILVTALISHYDPPQEGRAERMGGPDLPGSMRQGSAALFDFVFRLDSRPALKDPRDAKSRYIQRVFHTQHDGRYLCKSRLRNVFPSEVLFNYDTGQGSFKWFLEEARKASGTKA